MTYPEFVDAIKGAAAAQVGLITGERDIVPTLYLHRDERTEGLLVEAVWLDDRPAFVENVVLPMIEVMRPEFVAWTFTGRRGPADGEFDHETAVALCIERERHETWLARLVRHDNRASLGAWRPWPSNQQEGAMLTPIQEALR